MKHHIREYGIAISFLVPILQKIVKVIMWNNYKVWRIITRKTKECFYSMFYRVMTISLFFFTVQFSAC